MEPPGPEKRHSNSYENLDAKKSKSEESEMADQDCITQAWVGAEEDLKWIYDNLTGSQNCSSDLVKAKRELKKWLYQGIGECQIAQCARMIAECEEAVLVLSPKLLSDETREKKYLYILVFALANLSDKPRCGILINMNREELPIGLKNMRFIYLKTNQDAQERLRKMGALGKYLSESSCEIKEIGNIAQGQAFSKFFGFFNIILPKLDDMWDVFKESEYFDKVIEAVGVECEIFPKMVEIVWPSGENPKLLDLDGVECVWSKVTDEDLQKIFTETKCRSGAKERSYTAQLHVVYNKDRSKAFLFVGDMAPACNVINRLTNDEDGRRHRRTYAETSQQISHHEKNTTCPGKLLVLQVKDKKSAGEEIFSALEKPENWLVPEHSTSDANELKVGTCLIANDQENDVTTAIETYLSQKDIKVRKCEEGRSYLDESLYEGVDLMILVLTENITDAEDLVAKDLVARCFAVGNQHQLLNLLVIKMKDDKYDESRKVFEMCPFTKEHQNIDDGLCFNSEDLERKFGEYLDQGPKHLLDLLLISNTYIGLAQAFVTNYLDVQVKKLENVVRQNSAKLVARGKSTILNKLYELVPLSGDCSDKKLMDIVDSREDFKAIENNREYNTPVCVKEINGQEVIFFMEYCTPIPVLFEMHQSPFAPLLTEDAKRREISNFIIHLQTLISRNPALKGIVRVVPLVSGDHKPWEEQVWQYIQADMWRRPKDHQ